MNKLARTAQTLFVLNAAIWLALGVYTLIRMAGRYPGQLFVWIVGLLMFGNALAMLISAFGLGKPQRRFFYFALGVLLVNILLTFTDQFGLLDLLTLLLDLVLLAILLVIRQSYWPPAHG